jgi:hypothetical protein
MRAASLSNWCGRVENDVPRNRSTRVRNAEGAENSAGEVEPNVSSLRPSIGCQDEGEESNKPSPKECFRYFAASSHGIPLFA